MTKYIISTVVSFLALTVVLAVTVFVSLPSTVLYPRDNEGGLRANLVTIMPQSWPFFTKPPSDSELTAYHFDGQTIRSVSRFPNSKIDNWYGLTRTQRAQGPELANLTNPVPEESWWQCEHQENADCLVEAANSEPVSIINSYPHQTLCGSTIIAETEPVRFTNRSMFEGWRLDVQALHLEVSC